MAFNPSKSDPTGTSFRYLIVAVVLTLGFSVIAIATTCTAYINWQQYAALEIQHQKQHHEQLQWHKLDQAYTLAVDEDYPACLQMLSEVSEASAFYPRAQRLTETCYTPLAQAWLAEAKTLANAGQLKDAIHIAGQVVGGPLQARAQQQIKKWSQRILELAKEKYYAPTNQLDDALKMLRAIPKNSPLYRTSQGFLKQWQHEWHDNQRYYQTAQVALDTKDPIKAHKVAQQITHHPAWTSSRNQLLLDIEKAKQHFDKIAQQVDQLLIKDKLREAALLSQQLPDIEPWYTQKLEILEQIEAAKAQKAWIPVTISITTTIVAGGAIKHVFMS